MAYNSVAKDKSMAFSIRIVHLYRYLTDEHKDYVLSKQVLRSGTSIGATSPKPFTEAAERILSQNSKSHSRNVLRHYIGWNSYIIATICHSKCINLCFTTVRSSEKFSYPPSNLPNKNISYLLSHISYLSERLCF